MGTVIQDIRYALRMLRKAPGFTAVAVLTLALGIGATTSIFSVVNGILLSPLPYGEPDRLVRVFAASPEQGIERGAVSPLDFEDWRAATTALSRLASYFSYTVNLTGSGEPVALRATYVSEDFFRTLGSGARLGRTLTPDDVAAGEPLVVLSDGLWRRQFGGDPAVVGTTLTVNDQPRTVVGVMPPEFGFPNPGVELWLPVSLITEDMIPRLRQVRWLAVVGRLSAGTTLDQANSDMATIAAALAREYPASNAMWDRAVVLGLRDSIVGEVGPALLVTLAAVGFVLLLVCANLANLLLARSTTRAGEMGLRAALGAGRGRLVRQLLTESLVLALLGGAAGLLVAAWAMGGIRMLTGHILPRVEGVAIDGTVLAFSLAVSALAALLFGMIPALRTGRSDLNVTLKPGGRGSVGRERHRARGALVIAQVALAMVLTISAGLMLNNFNRLRNIDAGFNPDGVLAIDLALATPAGLEIDAVLADITQRIDEITERLRALPGVAVVASVNALPLRSEGEALPLTRDDAFPGGEGELRADGRFVSSDYFRLMGIPVLRGDGFPESAPEGVVAVVVSQSVADRFWPGENAVGRTMQVGQTPVEVIGVVGEVRSAGLTERPPPTLYLHQTRAPRTAVTFLVRAHGEPLHLVNAVRQAVWSVDPDQPINSISTLNAVVADAVAQDRFFTLLLGFFGVLALLLAAIGIYGVLAYSVNQQTREIGVRVALGARPDDVLRMVFRRGMRLVAVGTVVGLVVALALTRLLAGIIRLVSTTDASTYALVTLLLVATAALASYLPARRATRVDPMITFRE